MDYNIYKKNKQNTLKWSGGDTTQLAIYPVDKEYKDRDFLWRLSTATIEAEKSQFSPLPEYDRVIMVLEGELVLAHQNHRVARLKELEQDSFSGAWETISFGKARDYNLMVKKGGQASLQVLELSKTSTKLKSKFEASVYPDVWSFYCLSGYSAISIAGETNLLEQGDQLVAHFEHGIKEADISIMGEGKVVWGEISLPVINGDEKEICQLKSEYEQVDKERNKASLQDFVYCIKLSGSNFRGGKKLFPELYDTWYDQELQKGIDRVEKIFLPFFVGALGLGACAYAAMSLFGARGVLPTIVGWLILDFFVISPCLYLVSVPKPVKKHIKKVNTLSKEEKEIYEAQKKENPKAERILKKYKITGRNKYID